MERNIGNTERVIRVLVGAVLVVLALLDIGTPWTWVGVLPILTGLSGWCPPYSLFGISTCKVKESRNSQGS